nr:zinc finger BED domain-containing protein RICESLEEPER 2-like [Tanacetum cinerariifolium]
MVASRCYYQNGTIYNAFRADLNYTDLPYTFSKVNKHTVTGCYDSGWLNAGFGVHLVASELGPDVSFSSLLHGESKRKGLNFPTLTKQAGNGADVSVPLESISMNPDVNLMKEDVVSIPVWVKLYSVPVIAFTEDGLSNIAMNIGTLLRHDSYTSDMRIQSWGRLSYARALIEIRAHVKFKDTIVVRDFDEQDLEEGESPKDVKAKCKHYGRLFRCHTVKHGNKNLKRHLLKCEPYKAKQSNNQNQIMFEHGDGNKMMAWKFDQKESKKALAHMVIVVELPFSFVELEEFRHYSNINQSLFDVPCRGPTTQDCYKLYDEEKNKLLNGIDAIMAVSVDNASANDSAIDFLRKTFAKKDNCLLNRKRIHIICAAHILNLVVQDGIKSVDMSIQSNRYANSILDVPTRWNSTYNMLEVAQAYEDGFDRYDLEDAAFGNVILKKGLLVLTHEDWDKARKLCGFLKIFYLVTLRIPGTKYVASQLIIPISAKRFNM